MKQRYLIFILQICIASVGYAQNTFPATGNVGIGTTTPASRLEVSGSTFSRISGIVTENVENNFTLQRTGASFPTRWETYIPASSTDLRFYNSGDRVTFLANGNVGIGTSTPITKLQLMDAAAGGPASTSLPNQGLLLSGYSTGGSLTMGIDATGASFYSWLQSRNRTTSETYNLSLNPAGGNVGIGTANPAAKLEVGTYINNGVLGTIFGRLAEGNGTGSGTFLGVRGYGTQQNQYSGKGFSIEHTFYGEVNSSINFYRGGGTTGGFISFNVDNNSEKVRILDNGNVGIGTANPTQKLTVNGTIYSKEVKVDLSVPGPDYVFEETYNLPSLAATENYIKQNKHLPEVPSACEMEENGINLSEMNMILLKKVEELTLYQIQSIKRIQVLEEELSKLKNKVNEE